jgi:hypothetical protein
MQGDTNFLQGPPSLRWLWLMNSDMADVIAG